MWAGPRARHTSATGEDADRDPTRATALPPVSSCVRSPLHRGARTSGTLVPLSVLLVSVLMIITGCGVITEARPIHRVGHLPAHAAVSTTDVGEVMYAEYDYFSLGWRRVRFPRDFEWGLPTTTVSIPAGDSLVSIGGGAYCTVAERYSSLGFRRRVCFADENQDMRFDRIQIEGTIVGYSVDVPYVPYSAGEKEVLRGGFRQEIVYQGVTGGAIRILYREYTNDFARPAYYQDISYDYQPGVTIRFKGARAEILDANREQVTYKVLGGFNK